MSPRPLVAPAIALSLIGAGTAHADEVIDWNNVTLDAIRTTSTPPPRATRALAMVHTAIFDAVNGIEDVYLPYHVEAVAPATASPEAAAATAAWYVLLNVYPGLAGSTTETYQQAMAAIPDGLAKEQGRLWGSLVGRRINQSRIGDGSTTVVPYEPSGEFGYWQPTPPAYAPAAFPNWPYVTPFCMDSGDQFQAPAPPPFISEEYAAAYNEVFDYGGVTSTVRTEDQTLIAYFWEDGAGTVTPPGHWHVIAQQLSAEYGLTLLENARLFALLSLVQADGAICSWDNKYYYDHLRPITAITIEADDDGNPDTAADPSWFNLIPTPPFPAYTSGHSTFSGGSARLLAHFFGTDDIAFCGESPDPDHWPAVLPGVIRCWDSFSEAAEEAGMSRIYGGIHWQYDNQLGLATGRSLADHVFTHFLQEKACAGDATGDGMVNLGDLIIVLSSWGACGECADCPADFNEDCIVNIVDLLVVLHNFGPCN